MKDLLIGNLRLVKAINKLSILTAIKKYEPISRAQIAKSMKLSPATVSTLVGELIKDGYLIETAKGTSSGGRRPIMLQFNHQARFIIGVELETESISVAVMDLMAEILVKKRADIYPLAGEQKIIKRMISLIHEVIDHSDVAKKKIIGIGIAAVGVIDSSKGMVKYAANLGWKNVPLRSLIKKEFNIPVSVGNISNLCALGEHYFGAGQKVKNLVYLHIGLGIGAGIIFDGRIYEGSNGSAGEFGHTTISFNGPHCSCGSRGCLEALASEKAIVHKAIDSISKGRKTLIKELVDGNTEAISAEVVTEAAKKGDALSLEIWNEMSEYIGIAIANLVNMYNPEQVIIGGTVAHAGDLLFKPIRKIVKNRALPSPAKVVEIIPSQLGDKASIIGAIALILENKFKIARLSTI